ncbi:MAG: helix-turn-helix domain-containing protein [Aquabacterium sp.]|uniref:helix-turn-helix domain-containing protein n=1 Tax=Aquabacterium sp. TaxID=1872578 RepID=UPI002A371E00|nr:helix-turn-helix domain-containing protein [Aquabacterium sp.]MDX9844859.1 helix-turn-helix domain-containing protein [Aquabacterium sp.]
MIRLRLTELLADASFRRGRRVELMEVAQATGIHRTTLSKMVNVRGYNATLSNIDALCKFFGCDVGDIATYVPDEDVPSAIDSERPPSVNE